MKDSGKIEQMSDLRLFLVDSHYVYVIIHKTLYHSPSFTYTGCSQESFQLVYREY